MYNYSTVSKHQVTIIANSVYATLYRLTENEFPV